MLNFLGNKFQLIQTTVKLICSCELLEKINLFHREIECASWIIRIIAFHDYRMFWRCRGCHAVGANANIYSQRNGVDDVCAILTMQRANGMRKKFKICTRNGFFFQRLRMHVSNVRHVPGIFARHFKLSLCLSLSIPALSVLDYRDFFGCASVFCSPK